MIDRPHSRTNSVDILTELFFLAIHTLKTYVECCILFIPPLRALGRACLRKQKFVLGTHWSDHL